ncbi:hypothetical protein [Sphingomonas psychrotolerans]|uniref:DUF2946 domain-containing protein n=1 Tax=Sphingomonas psychrotolerans TaxID=1327635 RepID=A0A2K8ME00_9SPHN|nr:hypothetical protein [Sphingomonas psychrotolerans]ATY31194.1 hypothetical protein CVN68_03690 [Sphingomonas psychrotolerans]
MQRTPWQRLALLLVGCALLVRMAVPAGWMPQANAAGVTLSWCADSGSSGPAALTEAKALLAEAIGKKIPAEHKKSADQPCAFAMAAQPLAPVDPIVVPPALPRAEPIPHIRLESAPGRGLAAPPPLATGPPRLG